jgi:hypothetical protein
MEKMNVEHGRAAFTLKSRLQRATGSHPDEAIPGANTGPAEDDPVLEETEEWFEVDENSVRIFVAPNEGSVSVDDTTADAAPCDSKSATGNRRVKAQFGRRRTHNEQLLVRPCGIIFAWATFFGAEAVSNVLVSSLASIQGYADFLVGFCQARILGSWCPQARASYIRYQLRCEAASLR